MQFALSPGVGRVIEAAEASYRADYRCPCCGAGVFLRSGANREPHFAHFAGQGSFQCEEYHPSNGGGGAVVPPRPREVEDDPKAFGLCVEFEEVQRWSLALRIPELPEAELGGPLSALRHASVDVTSGGARVASLSALDLRPGVGLARVVVRPSALPFECAPTGEWPPGVEVGRWTGGCPGLAPAGTLFRARAGEWVRAPQGAALRRGEEVLLIAHDRSPPPRGVAATAFDVVEGAGLRWRLWRLALPQEQSTDVAAWLSWLGYGCAAPAWRISLLSIPQSFVEDLPSFPSAVPVLAALHSPASEARATLQVRDCANSHVVPLDATTDQAVAVTASSPGEVEVRVAADADARARFMVDRLSSAEVTAARIATAPRLRIEAEGRWWGAFGGSAPRLSVGAEVRVDLGVEGERLSVLLRLRSGERRVLTDITVPDAQRALTEALEAGQLSSAELDAYNLGRLTLTWQRVEPARSREDGRLMGWLRLAAASTEGEAPLAADAVRHAGLGDSDGGERWWLALQRAQHRRRGPERKRR